MCQKRPFFREAHRRNFSEVGGVASRNGLYQILAMNVALGVWQRAKMRLSPVPIGKGMGACGGDCYRELPRNSILGTSVNKPHLDLTVCDSRLWVGTRINQIAPAPSVEPFWCPSGANARSPTNGQAKTVLSHDVPSPSPCHHVHVHNTQQQLDL